MRFLRILPFTLLLGAESAHVNQEKPVGGYHERRPYGTAYVLRTKCPVFPGTIHLTIGGLPYEEGKDFYAGELDPHKKPSGLAPNEIAALNFDLSPHKGKTPPPVLVDYDTPDANCAAQK
jgi:hypothetical protein